jgi:hypothetical protein
MPCGHPIHSSCLAKLTSSGGWPRCPLCKRSVVSCFTSSVAPPRHADLASVHIHSTSSLLRVRCSWGRGGGWVVPTLFAVVYTRACIASLLLPDAHGVNVGVDAGRDRRPAHAPAARVGLPSHGGRALQRLRRNVAVRGLSLCGLPLRTVRVLQHRGLERRNSGLVLIEPGILIELRLRRADVWGFFVSCEPHRSVHPSSVRAA